MPAGMYVYKKPSILQDIKKIIQVYQLTPSILELISNTIFIEIPISEDQFVMYKLDGTLDRLRLNCEISAHEVKIVYRLI